VKILLSSICPESGTDIQLALYYLKGFLLQQAVLKQSLSAVHIRVFNEIQTPAYISNKILVLKPDVAGFSCYLWNIEKTLAVCRLLKKRAPQIVIVLGGPEVTPRPQEILEKEAAVDIVVRGEGEASFAACVDRVARNSSDFSGIRGISFRQQGKAVNNPDRPQISRLGAIPSPYLSGLADLRDRNIVDVPLETMRGCSSQCRYCFYHKNFPRVRFFPLARVEKELTRILLRRPHEVYLMDATFNAYPARAKKILKIFIRHNRGSNLHVELKAELIDEEMVKLLRKARAFNIEIGIQSTNPQTLKAINRQFDKKRFEKGIRLLNTYGLLYEIQLIDALPYQSYNDLKDSLDWLYSLHPVKVIIFRLAILPGTELRKDAKRYGIEYGRKAPYNAYQSSVMSREEVLKVERLRSAMERLYDSQVFQAALYALKEKHGLRISDILDDWIAWQSRLRGARRITPEGFNRRLHAFSAYVCRRRRISAKNLYNPGRA
jgi:radical SAM superfamily enzyme YgiQ (UPF0313 family)